MSVRSLSILVLGAGGLCVPDPPPLPEFPGMVEIPGGVFEMGSELATDEQPIRQVNVDTFWMDRWEVSVADYAMCVDTGACSEPGSGTHCNYWSELSRSDHPVNCVDWQQAQTYCEWVEGGIKRLPTEAEWEKAARSSDARTYPWGDDPEPSCLVAVIHEMALGATGCGANSTFPVGQKPSGASPYGVLDMAGNVFEWVGDWYQPYDIWDTENPAGPVEPVDPMDGSYRVHRGGSWNDSDPELFRAAHRAASPPTTQSTVVGFRCAATPLSAR